MSGGGSDTMKEFVDFSNEFKPEGKIKVELFDDLTGRKIEEIETNNFIAKGVNYYFRLALIDLFTKYKSIHSIEHYYYHDLISRMVLTNATHPEQPEKEWYVKGEVIGWAVTEDAFYGDDEREGYYNVFESFTTREQVHIVIDFPTNAANGTFQSIYFTHEFNPPNFGIFRPFVLEGLQGVLKVQKYNNEIWVLHHEEEGIYSSAEYGNVLSRYDTDFNLIETYEFDFYNEILDFCIHNNYIYFTDNSSFSRGLQRAPLSDPTNYTTIIDELINGNERLIGIVFDHKNNQFVISSAYDSDKKSISRFDTNFNILSNTPFDLITYYDPYFYTNLKLFINDDGDIFVNGSESSYILQNDRVGTDTGIGLVMGVFDDYKVMRDGEVMPQIGISSRALLDTPVTKTSSTTMKITYDFMLPEFHWYRI